LNFNGTEASGSVSKKRIAALDEIRGDRRPAVKVFRAAAEGDPSAARAGRPSQKRDAGDSAVGETDPNAPAGRGAGYFDGFGEWRAFNLSS
jgi:hypothetical protein